MNRLVEIFSNIKNTKKKNIDNTNKDRDYNIEYVLSIHSTRHRSSKRLHVKDDNDIITIDEKYFSEHHRDEKIQDVIEKVKNKDRLSPESISFSGGGYNCTYHLGAVRYIFENNDMFHNTKYLGASGGAGIICIILCYEDDNNRLEILDTIIKEIIELSKMNLELHEQVENYSNIIQKYINEDLFNKKIKDSNRCHISVTDISGIIPKNTIISEFKDYNFFINTLKASACIPILLDNKVRTIDDKYYIDGGLTNNLPSLNNNTLKISCLNYPLLDAHIYPKVITTLKHTINAPSENYILNMHDLGYNDIFEYMKDNFNKIELIRKDKELDKYIKSIISDMYE